MNLLVLLLIALPMCIAQFSIQGPSDGNRVAQGLVVEEGKGIRYTEQNDSPSGFTIQGATDGHSSIQGADDGHSNFQIQGATAGTSNYVIQGASSGPNTYSEGPAPPQYNIQGATDGRSQAGYGPGEKSLQYNDPSGLRVNWRSFERQQRLGSQQQAQYAEAAAVPHTLPRIPPQQQRAYARPQPQPQPQPHPQPQPQLQQQQSPGLPEPKPFEQSPAYLKQLLQYQLQLPYLNNSPHPYRYDGTISGGTEVANQQQAQYQNEAQGQLSPEPRRPAYRGKSRVHHRQRRQAPQHGGGHQATQPLPSNNLPPHLQQVLKFQSQTPYQSVIPEPFRFDPQSAIQDQMQQVEAYYRNAKAQPPEIRTGPRPEPRPKRQAPHPQPQPQQVPAEPQLYYSTNIPGPLQQLMKLHAQLPYNIIPNEVSYKVDKTFVPQPIPTAAPAQQAQYQDQGAQYQDQGATYQGQGAAYQGQPSGYSQSYQSEIQYPQPGYQQPADDIRPVTEN
ncbi:uncharacterized protein LOC143371216 [Andrena cerasifolii]|uniref:uncharacterized protein LOC143371216 n=1 Tax=Andrena cerasifolii TaxID=2819439 RepID=UPI00403827EC